MTSHTLPFVLSTMTRVAACFILGVSPAMANTRCGTLIKQTGGSLGVLEMRSIPGTCAFSLDLRCSFVGPGAGCPCEECCVEKNGSCYARRNTGVCGHGKAPDPSKGHVLAADDGADFHVKCCSDIETCDTYVCPAGSTKKDPLGTCGLTCSDRDCCIADSNTCGGMSTEAAVQQTCGPGTIAIPSAYYTVAINTATCCKSIPKGCQDLTCPSYLTKNPANTHLNTDGFTETQLQDNCCMCNSTQNTCCAKALVAMVGGLQTCEPTHLFDPSKAGLPVMADNSDFKEQCCTEKAACDGAWNTYVPPKATASAIRQALAVTIPLALVVALFFGQ